MTKENEREEGEELIRCLNSSINREACNEGDES